jgi:hypothetical protein
MYATCVLVRVYTKHQIFARVRHDAAGIVAESVTTCKCYTSLVAPLIQALTLLTNAHTA